jgi:ATP-dependent DNA ligase
MDELALVCEQIASYASRLKKVAILADYLRRLDDADLALAVHFLDAGPIVQECLNHSLFEFTEKPKLLAGYAVLRAAVQAATGWDTETLAVCCAEVGDIGETAGLLLRGMSAEQPLSLARAQQIYGELSGARTTAEKRDLLVETFRSYRPLTIKYFVKVITRALRIGLTSKMTEEAVGLACGVPPQRIRAAKNQLADLARVALTARGSGLMDIAPPPLHEPERRYGTLDVAITSAERGRGERAMVFSDYTFAVRSGETFVNIGKACCELPNSELRELTRVLRTKSTGRFGPVTAVRPEVVLEVAFDGVQKSARHKSGYALRFPRILRWRRDKRPEECDDLARVEALYQASLQ